MKSYPPRRNKLITFLEILVIPAVILFAVIFHLSQSVIVPLVVVLGLVLGAVALWARANKNADGSEWWQDDESSGWRGY